MHKAEKQKKNKRKWTKNKMQKQLLVNAVWEVIRKEKEEKSVEIFLCRYSHRSSFVSIQWTWKVFRFLSFRF